MIWRSEKYRRMIASLPCVNCDAEDLTQAAHQNQGKGTALKTSDATCVPLCWRCHTEYDQGSQYSREEKRQMFWTWLGKTHIALVESGQLRMK